MATLPSATQTIDESSSSFAAQTGLCAVLGVAALNADSIPRIFASAQDMVAFHGYSPAIDYCAMHFNEPDKPVMFVGLPAITAGAVTYFDNSAELGTCNVTVTADTNGIMEQVSGSITGVAGSVIGTDQIVFDLSCDGGLSTQRVRLSTATTYKIPNLGIVLNFLSGSTFLPGDVVNFATTAPMWGSTALSTARPNLVAQQQLARTWMVVGDLPNSTFAGYVTTEVNGYETANSRFTRARAQVVDGGPLAVAKVSKRVFNAQLTSGTISYDGTAHTITRSTGSFITDGFVIGMVVTGSGATNSGNNGNLGALTNVSATVLTFASGLVNEGPDTVPTVPIALTASRGITFASTTLTRSSGGSFITEGFAIGQTVSVAGTTSNNVTVMLTNVSATVLTVASGFAVEGPLAESALTITQVQTLSAWINAQSAAFASVDAQRRIDLAAGRGRKQSPITGWTFRRPCAWAASLREYQHDVQIPTWRKTDGPLDGWSLTDANGNKVEFDEQVDGGALAGRFTCFRSWANGPRGPYIALSLTRDSEGLILSRSQNMDVCDLAQTVVQQATEDAIGQVLVLNSDGTGTPVSLSQIEKRVNKALQINLLQQFDEGQRASSAVWTASRTDVLSTPGSTMHGTLDLNFNGTIEHVATRVRVNLGA